MKKGLSIGILAILVFSMLSIIPVRGDWGDPIPLEPLVSDSGDLFKYGSVLVDDAGYPQPPEGDWSTAVSAWRHPTWKRVRGVDSLYDAGADWIWRVEKVSSMEQDTGSIVFYMQEFEVSGWLSEAYIDITVDNAFYLYVASEADEATGPVWSGPPLHFDGFIDSDKFVGDGNPGDLWELSAEGYYIPKPGVIDIDSEVVRSIEHVDLKDHLKLGRNWLSIVAFNAHPEPKSKQVSSNTAGMIYKLGATQTEPKPPAKPGIRDPLEDPVPAIDYSLTPLKLTPIQAVWECDLAGSTGEDGVLDMVLGKPMAVQVSYEGELSLPDSVHVTLEESTPVTLVDSMPVEDIFSVYPFVPTETGPITITGYALWGTTQVDFEPVEIKVSATYEPSIAFCHLYNNEFHSYGTIDKADYVLMVDETASFINVTWPVANITINTAYYGIAGAGKAKKNDAYRSLFDDCVEVATYAKWRLGTDAFGIGIGPEDGWRDYFEWHGHPDYAGISFGESVRGMIVLDGYYSVGAHELGHGYGIGDPEHYLLWPPDGRDGYGIELGYAPTSSLYANWRQGLCFMGAGAYRSIEDHWVHNEVYESLFEILLNPALDPEVVMWSGTHWLSGEHEGEVEVGQGIRTHGFADPSNEYGNYAFIFFDESGTELVDEFPFLALPEVIGEPAELAAPPPDIYGRTESNFAAFSLSFPLPSEAEEIWWIERKFPETPLAILDVDDLVQLDTFMTDSMYNPISSIECHFGNFDPVNGYTLLNSNPGSLFYNAIIDYNLGPTLTVQLPLAENSGKLLVPAFDFVSQNYVTIYSDRERSVIATDVEWNYDEETRTFTFQIPPDEVRYVTIHLDYALDRTSGWFFVDNDPTTYHQDLKILVDPIPYYDPLLGHDVVLDLNTDFEAIGR